MRDCQGASVPHMCKTSHAIWNGDSTNDRGSGGKDVMLCYVISILKDDHSSLKENC